MFVRLAGGGSEQMQFTVPQDLCWVASSAPLAAEAIWPITRRANEYQRAAAASWQEERVVDSVTVRSSHGGFRLAKGGIAGPE